MLVEQVSREFLPVCDRIPPGICEIESHLLPHLALIDHGYSPTVAGNTAASTCLFDRIYTAAHNLHQGRAGIIRPFTDTRIVSDFLTFGPDSAVSAQPQPDAFNKFELGLPLPGDLVLAFWLRHIGGGIFLPCHMWGTNVGQVQQSGKTFWGFQREGIVPRPGDSGALVLTIGRDGNNIPPEVVGVLRGTLSQDTICVFSPLTPQR